MGGATDDETLFRARTERMNVSQTELGMTIRATEAPATVEEIDPAELPRITLDTQERSTIPPSPVRRADLALVTTLGEGGMGRVHLARQHSLDRDVAVKTLKSDATKAVSHALLREARLTGKLEHPGVIPVHALGVDDQGRPMLVMKRVDGVDLSTRLDGKGQTGERLVTCLEALMQVCRTCEFAHSRGVIHRDIKPENIMVGGFGEVYLLDWGIATRVDAKRSADDTVVGTPVYMAPEMVLGRAVDARTDVYLLGATLHEILTGVPRHGGKTITEVARNALLSEPFAYGTDVPDELATLCNRATAKDPADRPQTAAALREELAIFLRQRAARAIADAACERLAELEKLLQSPELPKQLARAYRLVAEARFGLAQSLEQGAADEQARGDMRRVALAAVDLELRQGHVDSAEALYRELEAPDASLEKRIADARAREESKAKEHARLERIERELDPNQFASARNVPVVLLIIFLLAIGGYLSLRQRPTTPVLLVVAILACVVVIGGFLVLRRRLMANTFNRRAAGLFMLTMVAIVVNRAIGTAVDRSPSETLAIDLFVMTFIMFGAAITLMRGFWVSGVVVAVGLAVLYQLPEHAPGVFTLTAVATLVSTALVLRRAVSRR